MPSFSAFNAAKVNHFILAQTPLTFNYPGVEFTRTATAPPGYDHDYNFVELGQGEIIWEAAKEAIRQWRVFPKGWTKVQPDNAPIQAGEIVAVSIRVLGVWWLTSSRIVYVLDNDRQFGFAYGTLPGHVERGEELFLVERTEDGRVVYSIRAFSQPRHWMARLGYPLARAYQRKFVRASKAAMLRFVNQAH